MRTVLTAPPGSDCFYILSLYSYYVVRIVPNQKMVCAKLGARKAQLADAVYHANVVSSPSYSNYCSYTRPSTTALVLIHSLPLRRMRICSLYQLYSNCKLMF